MSPGNLYSNAALRLFRPWTHLHGVGYSEFCLALAVEEVLAEVLAIQQGQREVHNAGRVRAGVPEQQMHAQHLVGGPLERDGPSVVTKAKVLRGGVAVEVACHRLGDNKGEDAGLAAVVQLAEAIQ